ncbi:MAG: cytochrome c [Hyphomicrobium sp.]|nr:cytochrome c [Hyphomicrobium sp.]
MMNHHRKCLGFRRINILNSSVLMCAVAFCVAAPMAAVPARSQEVPAATRPSDDDLRRSDWIAQGRAKFISACSYCHGSKGDAGKVKSFTERSNWNPQSIHDVITNGRTRGSNVMPPWGGSIADDEIWRIVAYIKSLSTDFKGPIPVENGN